MADPIPPGAARIRMYRQGLGDCFLVTLSGVGGRPFHMLMNCGLHMGAPDEAGAMERVARDIEAATEGRLDLVVVSHDHWSQVSGFALARRVFDRISIGEVWFGWVEDPADPRAESIALGRARGLRGLRTLANRLARSAEPGGKGPSMSAKLSVPLGFLGPRDGAAGRRAIERLKDHPSRPRVRYQRVGGSPVRLPGSAGAFAYVLGPSADAALPLGGSSSSMALLASVSASAAATDDGDSSGDDGEAVIQNDAFDDRYRLPPKRAELMPFFRRRYLDESQAWRRVDQDWMAAGASLALGLVGRCNNLSLALAIEVEPGGAVLLFPGDAQTKEWAAWTRLRWRTGDRGDAPGPATATVTGADLLARTVLCKVGNHGAAIAAPDVETMRLMTDPNLTAMLSVDQEFAEKSGWRMPEPRVLERLGLAARGRLLRSDRPFPDRPEVAAAGEWAAFREAVVFDPDGLHVDLHLASRRGSALSVF